MPPHTPELEVEVRATITEEQTKRLQFVVSVAVARPNGLEALNRCRAEQVDICLSMAKQTNFRDKVVGLK